MKISIKNISILRDADIDLSGITIITGINDSGKSTYGKVLFAMMSSIFVDEKKHHSDDIEGLSVARALVDEYFELESSQTQEEILEHCQELQHDPSIPSSIELTDPEGEIKFTMQGRKISLTRSGKIRFPIFLFDPLNISLYRHTLTNRRSHLLSSLLEQKTSSEDISRLTDTLIKKIQSNIKGRLVHENGHILFEKNKKLYSLISASSGARILKTLEKLLEANSLTKDTILIIDEPEMYLHPKLQILLSELLVDISKHLGCLVLLMTHSPYVVDGINCFASHKKFHNINFYMTEKEDEEVSIHHYTSEISPIIEALSEPLISLEQLLAKDD